MKKLTTPESLTSLETNPVMSDPKSGKMPIKVVFKYGGNIEIPKTLYLKAETSNQVQPALETRWTLNFVGCLERAMVKEKRSLVIEMGDNDSTIKLSELFVM